MHQNVVVDESFHRANSREFFFAEARKYFDKVIFVWIDSDDEHIKNRLQFMRATGMIKSVRWALQKRARQEKEFEPFSLPPLTFYHALSNDNAVERLIELIRTEAPEIEDPAKNG